MNVIATMNVRDVYSTQSLIVMPGCTLEVWDKDSNPESKTILNTVKKKQSQNCSSGFRREISSIFLFMIVH